MSKCQVDSDCNYLNECVNQVCKHYGIFDPDGNLGLEIFSYILIILIVGISKVGGIGGGIVKVPIMQLILQYETKQATYLIYPLLFATGITNAYLMMVQKHPFDNRPLIRYNVSLMMLPMIMIGSSVGVMINQTAPDLVLTIILALFLVAITPYLYNQYKQAGQQHKQQQQQIKDQENNKQQRNEQIEMENIKIKQPPQSSENESQKQTQEIDKKEPYLFENKDEQDKKQTDSDKLQNKKIEVNTQFNILQNQTQGNEKEKSDNKNIEKYQQKEEQELQPESETDLQKKLMKEHSSLFQWKKFLFIMIIFLTTQFFNFLKGGKALKSFAGITICSDSYWGSFAANLIVMCIFSGLIWIWIKHQIREKEQANFKFSKIDVRFSNRQLLLFASIGLAAGLFTSATGLGSGLIMVPGLLFSGLDPRSAASVSGFVITFLSSNSLIILLLEGYVSGMEIVIYLIMGFLAGTVFAKITYYLMTKYKAHRLVILIVLVVDVLNILSAIGYLIIKIENKGLNYVLKTSTVCSDK